MLYKTLTSFIVLIALATVSAAQVTYAPLRQQGIYYTPSTRSLKLYDSGYTSPNFTPLTSRLSVASITAQSIPVANNFIGTDQYFSITPQNIASKTFVGERNTLILNGQPGPNTDIIGHFVSIFSTWAPVNPLRDVFGIASTVDIGANAGANSMVAGRFRSHVGSVNVGAVTRLVGVDAFANYGYAATVTDTIGVSASTSSQSDFGGTTENVKLFHATKGTTNSDVTNFYAFYAGNYGGGTAPITNNYGIYLDSTIDQGTNRWAIYSASTARSVFSGTVSLAYGANVASAATIAISGNYFTVTGTTNITAISTTGVAAGTCTVMKFAGVLTVTDNNGTLDLANNFVTTANDTLQVCFDGTNWTEVSRSIN